MGILREGRQLKGAEAACGARVALSGRVVKEKTLPFRGL